MNRFYSLVAFMLLGSTMVLTAADKPDPTFSGKYKNQTVKEVLADLKNETGVSVKLQKKQVPTSRKVTVAFRNATPDEVLDALFDCSHVITHLPAKNGKMSKKYEVNLRDLSPREEPMGSYRRDTVLIDTRLLGQHEVESAIADEQVTVLEKQRIERVSIEDSIRITQERINYRSVTGEAQPQAEYGHHSIQGYLGGAYSSLGYKLQDGKNLGGLGAEAAIRYAYFFTPEWGLSLGVDYDTYQSYGRLNTTCRFDGQMDSEGERYNHLAMPHDWTERQRIHELSVPLMAEYQHRFDNRTGIFCALGAYVGFPLAASQQLRKGQLEHQGEYPQWGLTLDGITGHDFYTEEIGTDFARERQSLALRKLTVGVKADLGFIYPITEQLDLFVGLFAKVDALDIQTDDNHQPLGWQQAAAAEPYRQHAFMPAYCGLVPSDHTDAVRPYEVGLKVGIHFTPAPKQKKPQTETICEVLTDTTFRSEFRYDTIRTAQTDTIVSLHRTLSKAVIWFAVNDYEHPRIEPADLLDRVAEILIANPRQHVAINGHASAEGNARANQQLSDRRAETITRLLIERGVASEQIRTSGFSSKIEYVADAPEANTQGASTEGRSRAELNRRVEIIPVNE